MNVSQTQLNRTGEHEGFRSTAYKDGSSGGTQKYSIGFGHQIQSYELYLKTQTISRAAGLDLLKRDMQNVVNAINAKAKKPLNQNQFDALCDFGFNCGVGALGNVINTLNTKGYDAVPAHINQYVKWQPTPGDYQINPTLVKRRAENVATWNGGLLVGGSIVLFLIIAAVLALTYYSVDNNVKIPYLTA